MVRTVVSVYRVGAMTYDAAGAETQGDNPTAPRVRTFWVVLDGGAPACPLCVVLPDGREALALFSGEEEARMFCRLSEEGGAEPRLRRTSTGEVLSLLYCHLRPSGRVALDPLPELLGSGLMGLITIGRERFARGFAGVGALRRP